jgi:hypothetical protein
MGDAAQRDEHAVAEWDGCGKAIETFSDPI